VRVHITVVTEEDLAELLVLARAYCDFYEVAPSDDELRSFSRLLIADPGGEGVQLLARDDVGRALGYATLYWSLSSLTASRIAIMDDLFVGPDDRGQGVARALIEECRARAKRRGATSLTWQTARTNLRAQHLYEQVGARRTEWFDYALDT
jgi:ribosomal protein S18 acetylase RimI-like enzyme